MSNKSYTCIETFSGAGGMALGLTRAGYNILQAIDNEPKAIETYNKNLAQHGFVKDIRDVNGEELLSEVGLKKNELDLFSGGPPCQGFSKQRRGEFLLDDPRNLLVRDYVRLIEEMNPKSFLFENVQIFGQKRGRHLVQELEERLAQYNVYKFHVCSSDFGLAQARGRFLMIGVLREISNAIPYLVQSSKDVSVFDAIGDLPEPPENYSSHPDFHNHLKCRISKENEERIAHVPQGGGWQDIPWELRLPCHQTEDPKKGGWPDVYGRLTWDGKCPTITGGFDSFSRGRYGHPVQNRAITPREAARLQGFPDEFEFVGNRSNVRLQIGNAVPPPLAEEAGKSILRVLSHLDLDLGRGGIILPEGISQQYKMAI